MHPYCNRDIDYTLFTVDILEQMGVSTGENGTIPDNPLTENVDSTDWQQISSDFPTGFALYLHLLLDGYNGSILSLNNGELYVSLESTGPALRILTVALPGEILMRAAIPSTDTPDTLQSIGISVQSKLLSVIVDCHLINSVWLANAPTVIDISSMEALNPPTIVSLRSRVCKL